MAENNCEYSELKTTLLEVWVPPVGVQSVADLWTSLIGQLENDTWATLYAELIKYFRISKRNIEQRSSLKTNIDCYFDEESPFQVSETFLSGSWAEGMGKYDIYYKIFPSADIVLCISCEGWPVCAREWITRERFWPDIHSVNKTTQGGFHIVPKSSTDGDFRLSFSRAEAMLIQTLSPLQLKVLRAFKAVVKYHQNTWSQNLQEIISSYHLKTIALWHFEKTSPESWTEETLVHHVVALLEELAEALRMQYLAMYFMPKVNILQKIDDPEVALELVERILQISRNFCAISTAVKSIIPFRFFKAREREFRLLYKKLNAEYVEKRESSSQAQDITLWTICKTVSRICKNKLK